MELEQALCDLAEVRDRLAHVQRFEGYSAPAAAASGLAALAAGLAQRVVVPLPHAQAALHVYLTIWFSCLACALALNYGAVAIWLLQTRGPGARSRLRTAALSIAPSVVLGGAVTAALLGQGQYALLPGTWFAFYALGLFASYGAIPKAATAIAFGFSLLALIFLLTPLAAVALAWWVLPLGFGLGQLGIAYLLWRRDA